MEENHSVDKIDGQQEYITEQEARAVKDIFNRLLKEYKEKDDSITDKEWLEQLFAKELPEVTEQERKSDAAEIAEAMNVFDKNYQSVNEAAKKGISKERWLAEKLDEASIGMAVNEYGKTLQAMDDVLYQKNLELAEALKRSSDGHIMMSPNLDGNIAENLIAKTTELNAYLQNKNVKVEVLESFTANSVDVRAINLDTGNYQNYQLKFGADAKATIGLIERGNYNNQRIVVPAEQLEEVQAYFKQKGSNKTITDHIEAWGVEGKSFTKADMKKIQIAAQEDGIMPSMDYNYYQTKDLAMSIGKNASAMALQAAAVTTGLNIASKIFKGEEIDPDELVEVAIKTGADTSIKTVTAGTLQVAIKKGIIKFIPKTTSAGTIANIACVGIENVKILNQIASGKVSVTQGLDKMGQTTISMAGGLWASSIAAELGFISTAVILGPIGAAATGFVCGMVGYAGGSKLGEKVYDAGKKVAKTAKSIAKTVVSGLKSAGRVVSNAVKSSFGRVTKLFGV